MTRPWLMPALALTTALLAPRPAGADFLHDDNVVATDNLSSTSHVYGPTVVGNALTGSGAVFGQNYPSTTADLLTVGGTINVGSDTMQAGVLRYAQAAAPGGFVFNGGSTAVHDSNAANVGAAASADLANASAAYQNLTPNGTVSALPTQGAKVTLTGPAGASASTIAVFSIDAAYFHNPNVQGFTLANIVAGETIVLDVTNASGGNVTFGGGVSFSAFQPYASTVLFNFAEATSSSGQPLSIQVNQDVYGTILAPYALVSNVGGSNIDGSVLAKDVSLGAEVHGPLFAGRTPPAVPEPASLALLGLGGLGLLGLSRRRRPACPAPTPRGPRSPLQVCEGRVIVG